MTTSKQIRHLVSIKDLTDEEFNILVSKAEYYKKLFKSGDPKVFEENNKKLLGRTAALIFSKRSTRTRISSEGAAAFFGAQPMFLGRDDIQLGVNESFFDTINVVSSMVSCIFARVNKHSEIQELCKYSKVPIINSLCDKYHPLQAICDMLTIKEHLDYTKNKLKMAWIGDSNNVINDMCIAALKCGIDVAIATPSNIEMDLDIVEAAKEVAKRNNCEVLITHDAELASKDADILVTDTFISMGEEYQKEAKLKQFQDFQINKKLADLAKPNYKFMHCLPRHHEEVTDEIFYDKDHSIVFAEAENRLYAAIATIAVFVNNKGDFSL
ncbi:probable Ornithine carbamoyltransferase [Saccharomycodes ludwigii]|uniref:ornithine carbamoyltransferase n=1 Tax=Saccharomycodes ludwigii TaxID=36035 RepID=A0A376B7M0_9ASCO|nr:probable Ornithine carbamoyltransferase [Saccharomycodes ludwigii]